MGAAMSMLSNLHAAGAPQMNLPKFDPFRHIDKRLAGHDSLIIAPGLRGIASALRRELDSGQPPSTGPCVTHGDFHCGQMIMDSVSGDWWLIDLDDMALGYPESDIANFCAHLATSRSISALGALDFYNAAVEAALGSYSRPVNRGRLNFFAAAAFLRRALKLAQRGCTEELALSVISAARRIFPT